MFLAENSIFTSIASLLYVFDILKAKNEDGKEIEPEVDYDGFIWSELPLVAILLGFDVLCGANYNEHYNSHAKPFPSRLVPRSKEVEALVMQE